MAVLVERDVDSSQPGHFPEDRVPVESWLAHHNPPTGLGDRMQNLHHHPLRPCSEHDLLFVNSYPVRDQPPQLSRQKLRIAVDGIDAVDQRRPNRRQRRKWALVKRKRKCINCWRQVSEELGGNRSRVRRLAHQSRPPQRMAAAPAKSPACAKAAIMITSPVLT